MREALSRRQLLVGVGACLSTGMATALAAPVQAAESRSSSKAEPFRYCLNMATIRGQKLSLAEEVEIAAKAGYHAVEPSIAEIQQHVKQGGSLADLRKRLADLGLTVESAIGFQSWCVDDDAQRAKGMEQMRRDMDLVAQLGGLRIAAPPAGANNKAVADLQKLAERYRAVLELGRQMGVVPQLEIWGGSQTLGRMSEAACVAIAADHADACLLLDVFHLYKGGSGFAGLRLLSGNALHVLHINDYPASPPRETISDAERVFPGDGVAPLPAILGDLRAVSPGCVLSLELFNRDYWRQDPLEVAKTGLEKMRAAVRKAAM